MTPLRFLSPTPPASLLRSRRAHDDGQRHLHREQSRAQYARLQINSDDPNGALIVALHGIGTPGTGGANEPSLPAILRAYNIPTITGDGVNDANMNQTFYPASPDASSQEVTVGRLTKAGSGPVTLQILASYNAAGAANSPLVQFGYYTPGSTSAGQEPVVHPCAV